MVAVSADRILSPTPRTLSTSSTQYPCGGNGQNTPLVAMYFVNSGSTMPLNWAFNAAPVPTSNDSLVCKWVRNIDEYQYFVNQITTKGDPFQTPLRTDTYQELAETATITFPSVNSITMMTMQCTFPYPTGNPYVSCVDFQIYASDEAIPYHCTLDTQCNPDPNAPFASGGTTGGFCCQTSRLCSCHVGYTGSQCQTACSGCSSDASTIVFSFLAGVVALIVSFL